MVLSGKQCTISPISSWPNFTKFEHNMSISVTMKTLEPNVENFNLRDRFSKKCTNSSKSLVVLSIVNSCCLHVTSLQKCPGKTVCVLDKCWNLRSNSVGTLILECVQNRVSFGKILGFAVVCFSCS